MRKKLLIIGMCVAMTFSMTACGDKKDKEKETTTTASEEKSSEEGSSENSSEEETVAGYNEGDKVVKGDNEVVTLADYTKLTAKKSSVQVSADSVESSIKSILTGYPVRRNRLLTARQSPPMKICFSLAAQQ